MFSKILITAAVAALAVGCAERKYLPADGNSGILILDKACNNKFAKSQNCVSFNWVKAPDENNFGEMIVEVFTAEGNLHDLSGEVAVVLWMPSMGHGSSPVKVEKIGVGTYRVTNVFFSMPGDWEIRVQEKEGKTVRDQAVIPLRI